MNALRTRPKRKLPASWQSIFFHLCVLFLFVVSRWHFIYYITLSVPALCQILCTVPWNRPEKKNVVFNSVLLFFCFLFPVSCFLFPSSFTILVPYILFPALLLTVQCRGKRRRSLSLSLSLSIYLSIYLSISSIHRIHALTHYSTPHYSLPNSSSLHSPAARALVDDI